MRIAHSQRVGTQADPLFSYLPLLLSKEVRSEDVELRKTLSIALDAKGVQRQ